MVYIANMMFSPVLDLLHAHGARDKVCHPELVSGSKLSAPHPTLSYLGEGIQVYPKADL